MVTLNEDDSKEPFIRLRLSPELYPFLHSHLQAIPRRNWAGVIMNLASTGLAVSKVADLPDEVISALSAFSPSGHRGKRHADGSGKVAVAASRGQEPSSSAPSPSVGPSPVAPDSAGSGTAAGKAQEPAKPVGAEKPKTIGGMRVVETGDVKENVRLDDDAEAEMDSMFG